MSADIAAGARVVVTNGSSHPVPVSAPEGGLALKPILAVGRHTITRSSPSTVPPRENWLVQAIQGAAGYYPRGTLVPGVVVLSGEKLTCESDDGARVSFLVFY